MKLLCPVLIFFMLNIISSSREQKPHIKFKRLSSKDGLSGDVVYCILQDRKGFLWIGTHRGMNRYDGYHFTHYYYDPADTNSLSGNNIACIKEDNDGILWISTNNGLNSLDPATGKIKRYELPDSTMPSGMEDIFLVNDSILLVNANTAIYKFNKKTNRYTRIKIAEAEYPNPNPFVGTDRAGFTQDGNGRIFIACSTKDYLKINWVNATSTLLALRDSLQLIKWTSSKPTPIARLFFDSENNAWAFSTTQGLLSTKISGKKVNYPYSVKNEIAPENFISNFYEEQGKRLWICTSAGLVLYDYMQNNFYRYRQQAQNEESLSSNRITCLTKDKNGTYWLGTFGSGLCYFTINPKFKHIVIDDTLNKEDRIIYGLKTLHSGRILVGTFSNTRFLIDNGKIIKRIDNSKDSISVDSMILETTGKSRETFSEDDYWVFHALYAGKIQPGAKKFNALLRGISLTKTIIDSHNNVWFTNGLELIGPNKRKKFSVEITDLNLVNEDHFLLSSRKGLILFNTKTLSIEKTYLPQKNNPSSIGSRNVGGILPDGKGNYWVTTLDAGVDFWNTKEDRFYHYTIKNGLPDNTIYSVLADKHGRIWFGTGNGLSCFDTATKTFTNYDESDGLINTEYNSGSACVDNNGYMYFGGMNGIDYFHPDSLAEVQHPPALYVSAFKVFDKPQPLFTSYQLSTGDNNISIEFTSNDLAKASKIFYRYRLKGVDKDWLLYKGRNSALYNKLPPGNYHFIMQASYNNKTWSKPLQIDFKIATPWFQAWWFFTLLALSTTLAVYLLFRYRLEQQLRILQVRNRIHRDLHDDVGATLSSVKAYSEILKESPSNAVIAELIKENASEMIERLEVIAWATNPHHDSFGSLIEKINHYAVPICFAKNIHYDISPDGIAKDLIMPGEIRQNIFLIVKEAINNTAKYAEADKCVIRSFIAHGKFTMEISDDGKGFDGAINGTGNGLQNMQTRIKEIGGEIFVSSRKGNGTKIKIEVPFPFKIPNSWDRKSRYV